MLYLIQKMEKGHINRDNASIFIYYIYLLSITCESHLTPIVTIFIIYIFNYYVNDYCFKKRKL